MSRIFIKFQPNFHSSKTSITQKLETFQFNKLNTFSLEIKQKEGDKVAHG